MPVVLVSRSRCIPAIARTGTMSGITFPRVNFHKPEDKDTQVKPMHCCCKRLSYNAIPSQLIEGQDQKNYYLKRSLCSAFGLWKMTVMIVYDDDGSVDSFQPYTRPQVHSFTYSPRSRNGRLGPAMVFSCLYLGSSNSNSTVENASNSTTTLKSSSSSSLLRSGNHAQDMKTTKTILLQRIVVQ
jgi:hypothetical protein